MNKKTDTAAERQAPEEMQDVAIVKPEDQAIAKPDYQLRVIEEKAELDERLKKLSAFTDTHSFTELEEMDQYLLVKQKQVMERLSVILGQRIERWGK